MTGITDKIRAAEPHIPLRLSALAIALTGALTVSKSLFGGAWSRVPITDFGRDILGAEAARLGSSPYQTIGELIAIVPGWTIPTDYLDFMVPHTPFSILLARIWIDMVGIGAAEATAAFIQIAALCGLIVWLLVFTWRRWTLWHGLALSGAVATSAAVLLDARWIQGAVLVAAGLATVYWLDSSHRRWVGLVLLGALIAWRPWLAPLAMALPHSDTGWRDGAVAGITALGVTMIAVPSIGGMEALSDWLLVASPDNLEFHRTVSWNLSLTRHLLPSWAASGLFLVLTTGLAFYRRWFPRSAWPVLAAIVILTTSPIVWPHYWLALIPSLCALAIYRSFSLALLLSLLMAWPFWSHPVTAQLAWAMGMMVMVIGLIRWESDIGADPSNEVAELAVR